jgi:dolichyl-diphosphooligosaccharide--protein glycosyltransferase
VLPWLALLAAAVFVRALRFGLVFVDGEVQFPHGSDELYHLRRIWFTFVNFPESLDFDFYVNHPEGAPPIWPPFFDWTLAALARALAGAGDQHAVEVFAAWIPPLIGGLAVLASVGLVRRTFSPAAGWVTGALLVPLPAHVFHSALGQVDHHVAVGLLATALVAAATGLAGPPERAARAFPVAATGLIAAAAILLWPGALLHVLLVQAFLVVQLLATGERPIAVRRARLLAATHAITGLALLPYCAGREWKQFGAYSPEVLSGFQPLWFAAGAAAFALAAELWSRLALGANRMRRIGSALALGALGLAGAWFLVPGLSDSLGRATAWTGQDPFLAMVAELQPLLYAEGAFDPTLAQRQFSYLVWVYPLALASLAWRSFGRRHGKALLVLFVSGGFAAATLLQVHFNDVFSLGFAWVMGPALVEALRFARQRARAPRPVWAGAALLFVLAGSLPHLPDYRREALASLAVLRGGQVLHTPRARIRLVMQRVARWLKDHTPPTAGYLDSSKRPEYGVLCAWSHGHLLRYYGERPVVQDPFGSWAGGDGWDAAGRYYASRHESEAVAIAERLAVRYVVATPEGSEHGGQPPDSMAVRLAGARSPRGGFALGAHALAHHRLLFVSDYSDVARQRRPRPWRAVVYEIVRGARVVGRAPGEAEVRFELVVPLPAREPVSYRASARVDPSGDYEIRLPYPSETGYVVRAGSQLASLVVREAEVRDGLTVAGPRFEP